MTILAFDEAMTFRWHDADGRLHVDKSNLTRVQVAPYRGSEIPGWETLGLDPDKVYYGYRPASELSDPETVRSVIGIPIQLNHHLDYPDAPAMDTRVGSTGDQAMFDGNFLTNSLHIQNEDACRRIRDGSMKQLSLAYHYEPDFQSSGEWKGQKYDFTMRHIRGQHLALVEEGRAGSTCCVADSAFLGEKAMQNEKPADAKVEETEVKIADAMGKLSELLRGLHTEKDGKTVDNTTEDEGKDAKIERIAAMFAKLGAEEDAVADLKASLEELAYEGEKKDPAKDEDEDLDPDGPQDDGSDPVDDLDEVAKDALKACGFDEESDDFKHAFAQGLRYGQNRDDEPGDDDDDDDPAVAQDAAIRALEAKFDAIEECRSIIGKVKAAAFDSAGSVYLEALRQLGAPMKGVTAKNAQAMYMGFVSGRKSAEKAAVAQDAKVDEAESGLAKVVRVRI